MATKNDVKRRLLALFMAFVMAFSLLPVSALADSDPVVELIVGEEKALPGVRESDNGQMSGLWRTKISSLWRTGM